MFQCVVQLFGFPKAITEQREVSFKLTVGATLADVIAGLRENLPTLEGFAIAPGENRLVEHFKFNLNGRLIYTDFSTPVSAGDRIALLIPVTGG